MRFHAAKRTLQRAFKNTENLKKRENRKKGRDDEMRPTPQEVKRSFARDNMKFLTNAHFALSSSATHGQGQVLVAVLRPRNLAVEALARRVWPGSGN